MRNIQDLIISNKNEILGRREKEFEEPEQMFENKPENQFKCVKLMNVG